MSLQLTVVERFLTWLDVERLLKQRTALWSQMPEWILSVDCFADGMEIRYAATESEVDNWLSGLFGHAYNCEQKNIRLCIGPAGYPVALMPEVGEPATAVGQTYPLWRDVTYLPDEDDNLPQHSFPPTDPTRYPRPWAGGPDFVSFHSFKGGVGRTSALMTYVAACMQESSGGPKKILVIDADLEAPGVSFWLDEANSPTVSFVQLLQALHYPPVSIDSTLDFFADELRKTSLSMLGLQHELFILPAALDLTDIQDMPVTPEHLARNPVNPWQLSDHLHALGQRLGVQAVFIDLRAGLSELASPILFDPRVDHFFVSTVALQSVRGMKEVLRRLHAFNRRLPREQQMNARPTMVLSLLTKELREAGHYERALQELGEAYPAPLTDDDVETIDELTPGVQWLDAEFLSTLMSIGSVREALEVLPQSSRLFASASEWARALYAVPAPMSQVEQAGIASSTSLSRQTMAQKLFTVCDDAQFAEIASTPILVTEPLLNLGKYYTKELPNLLMIGAKGAGKTFIYRQLVATGSWQTFLKKLDFGPTSDLNAAIFPILWSKNIQDTPDGEIKKAQMYALDLLNGDKQYLLSGSTLSSKLEEALSTPPSSWENFWDTIIMRQLGGGNGGLHALNQALVEKAQRIIFVFDGIEDAFQDTNNQTIQEAIQALLWLPNRISELENRHIGVVIFVREDYVQATVRQNQAQLLQRYNPFRLQWDAASFLRLAYMLSHQANIIGGNLRAESLRISQLKDKLEILWGKKLGSEKSKEAYSARWAYAALCDLRGNVQARDLVRFLKFAAELEAARTGSKWQDRVLSPESMRKAIPLCSKEKVKEAGQEIAPLAKWMKLMEDSNVRSLKVPFSQAEAQLTPDLLRALREIGVIYEDQNNKLGDERLFLPEIYRSGLGFETSVVGRPRTQALLKKNIGNIPL